jgi:glycerophosphoryl diester phosphodiesterase
MPLIQLVHTKSIENIAADPNKLDKALKGIKEYATGLGVYHFHLLKKNKNRKWEATELAIKAKKVGLLLHPYTLRADQVPDEFESFDKHVKALVEVAQVDGFFSDFTDKTKDLIKSY